jgi:transcriptional regulator with XRE-family HTH domain
METFGERLRKLRTQRNLSLDELAAKTGLSKAYLWRLETNPDVNPSIEVAQRLALGLEVAIGALIAESSAGADGDVEIPPTLRQAQERFEIPAQDLPDLARIRFRGAQPMTVEDWGLLYLQLKKTVARE